ncbi:MAG TPA: HNH endonuclease, partial [Halomonas sp.]|nr:HNH endonuclease [Halomonas sp.]
LEIEHVVPRSRGGSDRISNLTVACHACNQAKGLSAEARQARVLRQLRQPLRDASAVNATRWALFQALTATGLPLSVGSGGLTKYNRQRLGIPKTHALDAACVGTFDRLHDTHRPTLVIKATGRGSYQRTRLNKHGFPRGYLMRKKQVHGFQTGDIVTASVPTGRKAGTYTGRVAVRKTGSFNIQTPEGAVQGIAYRHCTLMQRGDGYGYHFTPSTQINGGAGHAIA